MKRCNRIRSAAGVVWCGFLIAGLLLACGHSDVRACRTPVFRYAMYNWPASPYYVFYFHHGQVPEEDEAVNKLLAELPDAEPAPANVALTVVDASKSEQIEQLPDPVEKAWRSHSVGQSPIYLIFTSRGAELFAGRLDAAAVEAMVASPARKRLGELLAEGNATVLLILTGPDGPDNERAEKVAAEVIASVAASQIGADPLGGPVQPMPEVPSDTAAGGPPDDAPEPLKVASLKVSRTDPAEKWLVDMLLAIEPDLRDKEFADKAMIFAIFGRGLASPPFIGKGITEENLTGGVAFLAGPCSCRVKGSNPGADLLFRWDWDATAELLATAEEQASRESWGYQEVTPGESADRPEAPAPKPEAGATGASPAPKDPRPESEDAEALALAAVVPSSKNPQPEAARSPKAPSQIPGTGGVGSDSASFSARQLWKYGIGLAAGAIVVLAAGFVLIRRKPPT